MSAHTNVLPQSRCLTILPRTIHPAPTLLILSYCHLGVLLAELVEYNWIHLPTSTPHPPHEVPTMMNCWIQFPHAWWLVPILQLPQDCSPVIHLALWGPFITLVIILPNIRDGYSTVTDSCGQPARTYRMNQRFWQLPPPDLLTMRVSVAMFSGESDKAVLSFHLRHWDRGMSRGT